MMSDGILDRLIELLEKDTELHDAVVKFLNFQAEAKMIQARAYAEWRRRTK